MILAQTQYSLKVESSCSIVAWWIMTIDSLTSWFTIGPIQCVSHTLMHLPLETYRDGQDKPFLQLGGDALQFLLDCPNPWTDCGQLIYLQGIMTCIFYTTPNAPKSCTMKETWVECSNQCQYTKGIIRGQLSLTL